jgi:membrane-bound acyltransferase YfiQ involved in biofilm formation
MREFLPWIEAARTVLMVGVVLVHTNILAVQEVPKWWPFGLWTCLPLGLLVPAFFLISGLVLGLGGDVTRPTFDTRRFLRRKLFTLVLPFLAWNAIMVGLEFLLREPLSTGQTVLRLLTGQWHLYFVSALLQCFGLFLVLRPILWGPGTPAMVVTSGVISAVFYGLASLLFWTRIRQDGFFEDHLDRTFAPWCFYFFLGFWLGQNGRARAAIGRFWWLLALLTLGAFQLFLCELRLEVAIWPEAPLLQFLGGGFPFQALGAVAYVGFFAWLAERRWARQPLAFLARLAPLSLGVYLCHNAILLSLFKLWTKSGWPTSPWVIAPSLWVVTFLGALLVTFLGRHLSWPGRILLAIRSPARPEAAPTS